MPDSGLPEFVVPQSGLAAVVLAGGRGTRLGGARKADLDVGGQRLLDVVLDALGCCDRVVVVGEPDLAVPDGVILTREEPPFAGPAAALAAGMAALEQGPSPEWVLCIGVDQPGVGAAVPALCAAAESTDGLVDAFWASGGDPDRIEWVASIISWQALRQAIADRGGPVGLIDCSMRRLLGGLTWAPVTVPTAAVDDIDTWEDHARWLNEPKPT